MRDRAIPTFAEFVTWLALAAWLASYFSKIPFYKTGISANFWTCPAGTSSKISFSAHQKNFLKAVPLFLCVDTNFWTVLLSMAPMRLPIAEFVLPLRVFSNLFRHIVLFIPVSRRFARESRSYVKINLWVGSEFFRFGVSQSAPLHVLKKASLASIATGYRFLRVVWDFTCSDLTNPRRSSSLFRISLYISMRVLSNSKPHRHAHCHLLRKGSMISSGAIRAFVHLHHSFSECWIMCC